jgi:chromate transporter
MAAWGYVRYHGLPAVDGVLYFVKPVIIAIVAQALWMLARTAVKSGTLAALTAATMAGAFAGVHEVLLLCGAGAAMAALHAGRGHAHAFAMLALSQAAAPVGFGLWPLFLVFFKTGALLFGSGYVLLAFLRADLVERLQWLTEQQLLDAIVVGQITPGPVFTTATFVGYLIGGFPGAAVATVAIFLPAFVFVALSGPLVPRLRASPVAGAVLDGVNVASVALMAVVTWQLGHAALVDTTTWVIVLGSLVVLTASEINSTWLIAAAAAVGLLSAFIR